MTESDSTYIVLGLCQVLSFVSRGQSATTLEKHLINAILMSEVRKSVLTLLHHANVDAAFEAAGLAVTSVVLSDGAGPIEWTGEGGFTLHAAPIGERIHNSFSKLYSLYNYSILYNTQRTQKATKDSPLRDVAPT